jgi:hypothetical protein
MLEKFITWLYESKPSTKFKAKVHRWYSRNKLTTDESQTLPKEIIVKNKMKTLLTC